MRVLVSSRDPAAAFSMMPIIKKLASDKRFEYQILASQPADSIFHENGFSDYEVIHNTLSQEEIEKQALKIISVFKPDFILVGLSGQGYGIDEVLSANSDTIPCYAVQDFWGDVNDTLTELPDGFFVQDEFAKVETLKKAPEADIIISGSIRHSPFLSSSHSIYAIGQAPQKKHISYFGMPLWHVDGYKRTIVDFAKSISNFEEKLLYRPHPKETSAQKAETLKIFKRYSNIDIEEDHNKDIELTLCQSSLVCSCFSSCGYDSLWLSAFLDKPMAGVVFLMQEHDVVIAYEQYSDLKLLPYEGTSAIHVVRGKSDLSSVISTALEVDQREMSYRFMKDKVSLIKNSSKIIVDSIETIISARNQA